MSGYGTDDFLARLDLTDRERQDLSGLGVPTALALAQMIQASRAAFVRMIGSSERAEGIEHRLRALLTPEELATLAQPPPPRYPLGALLPDPPSRKRDHD